ncbi:MAG: methyltransferase domain-containing protein [Chloroflexi bacterium]|nr:methyltransferase domain-containing protein [Chloroflexota bacterium]
MSKLVPQSEAWTRGDGYEPFIGRWSRLVAREFVKWLDVSAHKRWLDVGCGTGALTQTILDHANPSAVVGVDRSDGYVEYVREQLRDPRASFHVADAQDLTKERGAYEVVVSGLVLTFVAKPERMIEEMARACRLNGQVALYVWDYAGEMQLLRHFWDACIELDPAARELDEGVRFPLANAKNLWNLFLDANLNDVTTRAIDVPTHFHDFDDYWVPFLSGQGPAPGYAMSLSEEKRAALRERIRAKLPFRRDGAIDLMARAWAVKGTR